MKEKHETGKEESKDFRKNLQKQIDNYLTTQGDCSILKKEKGKFKQWIFM
ncbi:hypothetical protein AALB16_01550 [Lachnospiraceae bacterium 62-35]